MKIINYLSSNLNLTPQMFSESHLYLLIGIILYMGYPKNLRINLSLLHNLSILHNGLLVLFNIYTFFSLSEIIYNRGIVFKSNYYFSDDKFDQVIKYFYLSKYYEFMDTFLLYLNGKNPIFLQKYHHVGAAIVWHLAYTYKVDCIWIASIANSFVHIIMYSYYLGCLLKINQVRWIKKYITILQLCQLIFPIFISLYFYRPPIENNFNYNIIIFFVSYVSVLIVLFLNFYKKNYLK